MIDKGKDLFRTWFAKVWNVRGGGLYAVGWAATFAYLEVTTIVGEILEADGIVSFLTDQLFEFMFRFLGESFQNMGMAFAWPAFVIAWNWLYGGLALAAAYFIFPIYVKPYITAWLFPDGEPEGGDGEPRS